MVKMTFTEYLDKLNSPVAATYDHLMNIKKINSDHFEFAYEMLLNAKYLAIAFDTIEHIEKNKIPFFCNKHHDHMTRCGYCIYDEKYLNVAFSDKKNNGFRFADVYTNTFFYDHYNENFNIDNLVEKINKTMGI